MACALPGCVKPSSPTAPQGNAPALACGNLHHLLLMAIRFNRAFLHPYQAILNRNSAGLCALLSCEEPPCVDHSWCSKTHFLLWLTEFYSSLHPDQICKLPGCTRLAYVDDNASSSGFCGWRHKQKFVMLSALQRHQREPLPSVEEEATWPASLNESERGRTPSLDSLLDSLRQFARFAIAPRNVLVIEDFYEMHPWEVLTEGRACWLIACPKFTSKGRRLTTKGHYHWKQSGRQDKKSNYTVKYYAYTKRKRKDNEAGQQRAHSLYTMKEYTTQDFELYSLVYLLKDNPFTNGKVGKLHLKKQQIAEQVDNTCRQDTGTLSSWDEDMLIDNFLNDLPSPDDDIFKIFTAILGGA